MKPGNSAQIKRLHDARRAMGVCINSALHGHAVSGGRCQACAAANGPSTGRGPGYRSLQVARVVPIAVVAVAGMPAVSSSWRVG